MGACYGRGEHGPQRPHGPAPPRPQLQLRFVKSHRGDHGRPRPVRCAALQPPPPRGISASSSPQPASRGRPGAAARSPSPGASLSSRASWARAPSGRAWQGPQMAAAPRRGWSRGGRRAPSRGSLGLALAAPTSTGEGRRGEASTEPARVRAAAAKVQAWERGAQRTGGERARCALPAGVTKRGWPRAGREGDCGGDSGPCPRRPIGARGGSLISPGAPAQDEGAKNAGPDRGVEHLETRVSGLGIPGANSDFGPGTPPGPRLPKSLEKEPRGVVMSEQLGVLPGPLEKQVLA